MRVAVVTGASSGMGREFVRRLDRDEEFDEIWAIARRRERLEALGPALRARLRPLALDLSAPESLEAYSALLAAERPQVAVLVNASGFGFFRPFGEDALEGLLRMVEVNDKALLSLCHITLPYLERGSRVFNIGSLSAFQPVPYMAVYAASKAFVLSFSRSLNVELRPRGVRVMAVCPGWVRTEFFDTAVRDNTVCYYDRYYEAGQVVEKALRDMRRGRDVSVCGLPTRVQVLLVKLLPHRLVMRIWCRQQKQPG